MTKNDEKFSVGLVFDDTLDSNDAVAQQVKRLGEWLSRNGHHVSYFCGETKLDNWAGGKVYSLAKNIGVKFNGNRLTMPLISHSKAINKALEEAKVDILHVQAPYSPLMAQRVINRTYKTTGIVGTFHILPSGWVADFGSRLLALVQKISLKKFDAMISVSSSAASFAKENFGIESVVIPNTVDTSKFEHTKAGNVSGERIVFLGRLVSRKGCSELIKAFSLLTQERKGTQLIVAGDGPERQSLNQQVDKLGLGQRVKFLGHIKEEEKASLLSSAAIACFPALYGESFGLVLIEAMAAGAGVILAGDNPGYRTVMGEQPKLLIDPCNTRAFADRLLELLQDKELTAEMHSWQHQQVAQYDVNVVGERVLKIYQQVIAKRRDNGHN